MQKENGRPIIGWREYAGLPDWGVPHVLTKIDTGARTSAIHVENIVRVPGDRVRFEVVQSLKHPDRNIPVETAIIRISRVRPSSGVAQERYVVRTAVKIGPVEKEIEVSLVCRKHMLCRMLLGRTALEDSFLIDPGTRYNFGRPKRPSRRKRS